MPPLPPPPPPHSHHKGLQYGLCAQAVDFWEEREQDANGRRVGRQVTQSIQPSDNGFSQEIVWRDGTAEVFTETRKVSVELKPPGFEWRWQTTLIAKRDVTLDLSAWLIDGQFGYVGLGLRLEPAMFHKKSNVKVVPKQDVRLGITPERIIVQGTRAALTIAQDAAQKDALYITGCAPGDPGEFAFVSLGPTNARGFPVNNGDSLNRTYYITVADVG